MDSIPEISLGSAALIIFGCCAIYMLLRGIARTIVNAACFSISAWVGFRVWQQAPSLGIDSFGTPPEFIAIGLALTAFLVTFLILRRIIRFFCSPMPRSDDDDEPRPGRSLVSRLLFTLIPAALLYLVAATFIHHASAVAEIEGDPAAKAGMATRLNHSLSSIIPEKLMNWLDPLSSEPRLRLAKMIASGSKSSQSVINPETGKPYPRAIIVDNPELKNLAREGRFSTLLRHPLLSEALKDPLIRQALGL